MERFVCRNAGTLFIWGFQDAILKAWLTEYWLLDSKNVFFFPQSANEVIKGLGGGVDSKAQSESHFFRAFYPYLGQILR